MIKKRVMLTFPEQLLKEPIIYNLSQQFKVVTNIRRADVSDDRGWVVLEMEGEEKAIDDGLAWITSRGVRIEADTVAEDGIERDSTHG